ncbi:BON domain-containing protein [Roseimaritima sediminicola]|uniref:BON domain-containing protein n=1 Tax=Roseimaritima sediminicola TaxID=2662066 RepID=UPI00129826B3|nr:BON domain-containing protein [Roseimaritima sediminicola]
MVDVVERREAAEIQARTLLRNSPIAELRELRIECDEGYLQISGRVRCFYHKQLAQETVRGVASGLQVLNAVDVD